MKKIFFKIHRILGSILSIVFLIWFLSGFLMIYSGFPHADKKKIFEKSELLSKYKNKILLPNDSTQNINHLTLEVINGKICYTANTRTIDAATLEPISMFSVHQLDSMVVANYKSNIKEKRILTNYDTWIPWSYFKYYFPIHKYYLNDDAGTQVYVSSKTGKIVQESTSKQRWFARFGAIPHWFYFKSLRLRVDLWSDVVIWLSGLGAIMCLTGLIVGFIRMNKWRIIKKKGLLKFSPYKEKWFRWHHVFGMIFGLFAFTFVFSGMMSMMDVPQWLLPIDKKINYNKLWEEEISNYNNFKLPISKLLSDKRFSDTKRITFSEIDNTPYYMVYKEFEKPIFINANRTDSVILKTFSYNELAKLSTSKFESYPHKTIKCTKSDYYYKPYSKSALKLIFADNNKTWLYIETDNPTTLRIINKSQRVSRWIYKGLHTFKFPKLEEIDWLRKTILIILSTFGTIISISGVVLSWRYFRRKLKNKKKNAK